MTAPSRRSPSSHPTEHLKHQWAEAAARVGIALDSLVQQLHRQTSSDYITASRSPTRRSPPTRPGQAPGPDREPPDAGDPGRDPRRAAPNRKGEGDQGGVFSDATRRLAAHRNTVPFG